MAIGSEEVQQLLDTWAKDRLRFAVCNSQGKTSAAWAIWFHNDSLYLAGRTLGRMLKVSLHPQGGYRFAYVKDYFERQQTKGAGLPRRDLVVWQPPQIEDGQTAPVVSLLFPAVNLHGDPKAGAPKKPLLLLEVPHEDKALQVDILLTRETPEVLLPRLKASGTVLHAWDKSDGSSFIMRVKEAEYDPTLFPRRHEDYPIQLSDGFIEENAGKNLTMMINNEPADGGVLMLAEIGGVSVRRREPIPPALGHDPREGNGRSGLPQPM